MQLQREQAVTAVKAAALLRNRVVMSCIAVGGAALFMTLFIAASIRTFAGNSDGATVVLEGQAMSAGHLTLHGWSMTVESFWSIDAIAYAVGVRIAGLTGTLMHVVPAAIVLGIILVGVVLARRGSRGAPAVAAGAVVVALLGLPSPDLSFFLLQGPWHLGTTLLCLAGFACLSTTRFSWRFGVAVLLFAAGLLGDAMALLIGVLPVMAAGLIAMLRVRNWKTGLVTFLVGPTSVVLALSVRFLASAIGTFALVNRNVTIGHSAIAWNIRHAPTLFAGLLGTGTLPIGIGSGPRLLQWVHLLGVVAVAGAVMYALVRLVLGILQPGRTDGIVPAEMSGWRIDDLLLIGFFSDLVTFVVLSPTWNADNARYLTPSVIFGTVLTGRGVAVLVRRINDERQFVRRCAIAIAIIVIGAFAGDVGDYVFRTSPTQPVIALTNFLEAHHLTKGVGDYWSSSLTTVKSGGAVTIRPVTNNRRGVLLRYDRQSSETWYAGQHFQFFVYDTARPWRSVNASSAETTFGPPVHTYDVGTYRVLTWNRDLTFSPVLPSQGNPLRIYWGF